MGILKLEEINLKMINERFKKEGAKYHLVNLGFPDIGREWEHGDESILHPEDWKTISKKISEDYGNINNDSIIITTGHVSQRRMTGRDAECFSDRYILK